MPSKPPQSNPSRPRSAASGSAKPARSSRAARAAAAERRLARRRAAVPRIAYPPELPVSQARETLLSAIRDHQVVVVAGETGSGKTTQLPKLCLELGRGVVGMIGHTQPRRLAARTVAARIAEELGVELGAQVGYQVRFTDRAGEDTLVKLMTDGILLAEVQRDRLLSAYDTIIIDEAHERSLNVDFLLGYLRQLLPRRPDLKLVITSATIDPQRFSQHFDGAPIVEVSGRTFPVEVRYRPLDDDSDDGDGNGEPRDQIQGICDAVEELSGEVPGDVLVFCSGEREIRDTADALSGLGLHDTEILPLYARLSTGEQQRVFQPHRGRRVVLATNVAETSLTVPGIRYVVDPGTARISRYSTRLKVQRLPIEPVSQASADQRKGRCGRIAEGICIRLYSEADFDARPAFTDPEILRTDLAAVLLQMTALGLGDLAAFPFIDPPDRRSIRDAVRLLHELGAVASDEPGPQQHLTKVGRTLARLPVDPRLARMIVEGHRNDCLREVLIVVAALSIQDPRERPADHRQAADEQHARFADERSDFLSYINLWRYVRQQQRELSSGAFRRRCKAEFLHFLRIREWQDLHAQLRAVAGDLGMAASRSASAEPEPEPVHRSLLAGLLSHVGLRQADTRDYLGARGARFALWPGSGLARAGPTWVMAAELVETSRLWARDVAGIQPQWAEQLAPHLVRRSYSEPHWERRRAAAVAHERVTLYGLPLVTGRKVDYAPIDAAVARELFLRRALVEGDWKTSHVFWAHNRGLLQELSDLEHKARRRGVVVDDEALLDFYDQRIPPQVTSARAFDAWWKRTRAEQPDLLTLTAEQLRAAGGDAVDERGFPDVVHAGEIALPVSYRFSPGDADDGVTVTIPLPVLGRLGPIGFDWQVPGFREELVTALLRSLPKDLRRRLVPVPDTARAVLEDLRPDGRPLVDALAADLRRRTAVTVPPSAWDITRVPDHLRITFRVVDGDQLVGHGKDLVALQSLLAPALRAAVADTTDDLERGGLRGWPDAALPRCVRRRRGGHEVQGFPALVDEGDTVGVRVLPSEAEQRRAMELGTRRLLLLEVPAPVKVVHARLSQRARLVLTRNPHGSVTALLDDCTAAAVESLMTASGGPAWDAQGYAALRASVRAGLDEAVLDMVGEVERVLVAAQEVARRLEGVAGPALRPAHDDVRAQLSGLVQPGFVTATGRQRLPDLVRYLQAMAHRVDKLGQDPARDRALMARVAALEEDYAGLLRRLPPPARPQARRVRWLIEELRVSLFAQHLGTRERVSEQRIYRVIAEVAAAAGAPVSRR